MQTDTHNRADLLTTIIIWVHMFVRGILKFVFAYYECFDFWACTFSKWQDKVAILLKFHCSHCGAQWNNFRGFHMLQISEKSLFNMIKN